MLKIGFIGAGKMAQALAKGFIKAGLTKGEYVLASCLPNETESIQEFKAMGSEVVFANPSVAEHGDVLILAVKPHIVPLVLPEIKNNLASKRTLLLSIAMGIPLKTLEDTLLSNTPVIRVMPNTPAIVGCGASVYTKGANASIEDTDLTKKLFSAVGLCEEVPESMMDAITALSASGPAYIYMMIEALSDGGVKMGLPRTLAYRLAAQTVIGAGTMVRDTKSHPAQLKDDVSSPAGSTISAIHALEQHGFRSAVISAVEAATLRCREVSSK